MIVSPLISQASDGLVAAANTRRLDTDECASHITSCQTRKLQPIAGMIGAFYPIPRLLMTPARSMRAGTRFFLQKFPIHPFAFCILNSEFPPDAPPAFPVAGYLYNPPLMFRQVPNALTASRLLLAVAFFIMLSFYQYKGRGGMPDPWLLHWAFIIYCVALVPYFLDRYLPRK